jgi:hypothetical protein
MRVIKSEWHQVERRYATEIDTDFLSNVYPDMSDEELQEVLDRLERGDMSLDELMEDAEEQWYDIDWEWLDEDDWWTDRKGGYDVTFQVE